MIHLYPTPTTINLYIHSDIPWQYSKLWDNWLKHLPKSKKKNTQMKNKMNFDNVYLRNSGIEYAPT